MKLRLITLTAIGALSLGTAFAQTPEASPQSYRGGGRGHRHNPLEQMTGNLNLTPDQKAKVQPIIDQATPQIESIRREAMQKTRAVMENAMRRFVRSSRLSNRSSLTPETNDRRGGRQGRGGRRGQGGQGDKATRATSKHLLRNKRAAATFREPPFFVREMNLLPGRDRKQEAAIRGDGRQSRLRSRRSELRPGDDRMIQREGPLRSSGRGLRAPPPARLRG